MSSPFKRRWAELAPLRESVLVNFTSPRLRRWISRMCEAITEEALEWERGEGFGESCVKAGARAAIGDLWHTQQSFRTLGATPRFAVVTAEERRLCRSLEAVAEFLDQVIRDLDAELGPPPPELPLEADRQTAN